MFDTLYGGLHNTLHLLRFKRTYNVNGKVTRDQLTIPRSRQRLMMVKSLKYAATMMRQSVRADEVKHTTHLLKQALQANQTRNLHEEDRIMKLVTDIGNDSTNKNHIKQIRTIHSPQEIVTTKAEIARVFAEHTEITANATITTIYYRAVPIQRDDNNDLKPLNNDEFVGQECRDAIKALFNYKSGGSDNIPAEAIKAATTRTGLNLVKVNNPDITVNDEITAKSYFIERDGKKQTDILHLDGSSDYVLKNMRSLLSNHAEYTCTQTNKKNRIVVGKPNPNGSTIYKKSKKEGDNNMMNALLRLFNMIYQHITSQEVNLDVSRSK